MLQGQIQYTIKFACQDITTSIGDLQDFSSVDIGA